jgi:hypothetical protein
MHNINMLQTACLPKSKHLYENTLHKKVLK